MSTAATELEVLVKANTAFVLKHKLTGKDVRDLRTMSSSLDRLQMALVNTDPKDFAPISEKLEQVQNQLDDWTYKQLARCYEVEEKIIETLEYPDILELFERLRKASTELPKNSSAPSQR